MVNSRSSDVRLDLDCHSTARIDSKAKLERIDEIGLGSELD